MQKKTFRMIMVAGALLAAGQFTNTPGAHAGATADLRAFLADPANNIDSFLSSNSAGSFRKDITNSNGSVMERLEQKCKSLHALKDWNVSCDLTRLHRR